MMKDLVHITAEEIKLSAKQATESVTKGEFLGTDKTDYYSNIITSMNQTETLQIGTEKSILLSNTIAQIVNCYCKSKKIDAIYLQSYNENEKEKSPKPTIELVLMYNDSSYDQELYDLKRAIKLIDDKTGIALIVNGDASFNYDTIMMHRREERACRDLVNGTILFDRTGEFIKLRDRLIKYDNEVTLPYANNIDFEPPLQFTKITQHKK